MDAEQQRKRTAAVVLAIVAVVLALWSLYRSFGPRSQWGSAAPQMAPGNAPGPAAAPAPLPPPPR
jgi:hypothetical protein